MTSSHYLNQCWLIVNLTLMDPFPDSKVHEANMGPTWVLSAPDGPHVGHMNLAIRVVSLLGTPRPWCQWPPKTYATWPLCPNMTKRSSLVSFATYIDGFVQKKRNLAALAMELRLFCIESSICDFKTVVAQENEYTCMYTPHYRWQSCLLIMMLLNAGFELATFMHEWYDLLFSICRIPVSWTH